jgi:hypothetical protein
VKKYRRTSGRLTVIAKRRPRHVVTHQGREPRAQPRFAQLCASHHGQWHESYLARRARIARFAAAPFNAPRRDMDFAAGRASAILRFSASMRSMIFSREGETVGGSADLLDCFLRKMRYKRIAIVILQHGRIEISRFRFDDMLRELHHLGGQLHLRNAAEIFLFGPHLVRKSAASPRTARYTSARPTSAARERR